MMSTLLLLRSVLIMSLLLAKACYGSVRSGTSEPKLVHSSNNQIPATAITTTATSTSTTATATATTTATATATATAGTKPLKCCVLCEPSPITYVSGYANRFQEMLKYFHNSNDDTTKVHVHLITTEVVSKEKLPTSFLSFPITHTRGIRLPFYPTMTISIDWTLQIWRVIHREKPDIIHASSPGFMVIAAFFYSRLYGIPLIVSYHTHLPVYVHSYVPWFAKSIAEKASWMVLRMMRLADLTLVTSQQIKDQFLERGVLSHCDVWQKGIDTERFHPRNKNMIIRQKMTNGNVNDFVLIYVGRIAKEKRLDELRDILIDLQTKKKGPNVRLCFVGTGPYHDKLKEKMLNDFPNAVVFLGELHGDELAQTYASADCFVFPSDSETLGFVIMEAMASGLPCVAANAGGVPSLINSGETSYLCTPGNTTEFSERIQSLREDPKLRCEIGVRARQQTTEWNWGSSMEKLRLNQYEQARANYETRLEVRLKRFMKRLFGRNQ